MKDYIVLGLVALILVLTIFQTLQISSVKSQITGNVVNTNSAAGGIDMTGWTETDKMNYEHHGILPARLSAQQSSAGAQMVGGC